MTKQKSILMVEDDQNWAERMKGEFKYFLRIAKIKARIIHAKTIDEAWALFEEHNPDIIIMDACVPGTQVNTHKLTKKIVDSGYGNPIITASSSSSSGFNHYLLEWGATHNGGDKGGACVLAVDLLAKSD